MRRTGNTHQYRHGACNRGKASPRILHFTMGSGLEDQIKPDSDMSIVGDYKPLKDGFNYEKFGVYARPARDYR